MAFTKRHSIEGSVSTEAQQTAKEDLNAKYDWDVTNQFIMRLVQEVSFGCSLPFSIPKTRIPQIVERVAKWWFRHAESAVEERWYVIRNSDLQSGANKTIRLPDNIVSISDCQMLDSAHKVSMRRATYVLERLLANSINFYGSSPGSPSINYAGPASSTAPGLADDYFMSMFEIGTMQSILARTLTFQFNPNTHKFIVLGDNEESDIVLLTYTRVPLYSLFEDERFLKHCVGECMIELNFILSTFDFKMPGNVRINYDVFSKRGNEFVKEAKEEVADDQAGDVFAILT